MRPGPVRDAKTGKFPRSSGFCFACPGRTSFVLRNFSGCTGRQQDHSPLQSPAPAVPAFAGWVLRCADPSRWQHNNLGAGFPCRAHTLPARRPPAAQAAGAAVFITSALEPGCCTIYMLSLAARLPPENPKRSISRITCTRRLRTARTSKDNNGFRSNR